MWGRSAEKGEKSGASNSKGESKSQRTAKPEKSHLVVGGGGRIPPPKEKQSCKRNGGKKRQKMVRGELGATMTHVLRNGVEKTFGKEEEKKKGEKENSPLTHLKT